MISQEALVQFYTRSTGQVHCSADQYSRRRAGPGAISSPKLFPSSNTLATLNAAEGSHNPPSDACVSLVISDANVSVPPVKQDQLAKVKGWICATTDRRRHQFSLHRLRSTGQKYYPNNNHRPVLSLSPTQNCQPKLPARSTGRPRRRETRPGHPRRVAGSPPPLLHVGPTPLPGPAPGRPSTMGGCVNKRSRPRSGLHSVARKN